MKTVSARLAALAVTVSFLPSFAHACASCGCTLSSDWENLNFASHGGLKLDLRYDDLDQNDLRYGRHRISPQAASQLTTPDGDAYEIEKYTHNQYLTAAVDYSNGGNWGVNVSVPWIKRSHETLGEGSDGVSPGDEAYVSDNSQLGDIRVVGRYSGFTTTHNVGLLFGLKLPTGKTNLTGILTDPADPGGAADIDPGLQPGSGTTDAILGAYYAGALSKDWEFYAQGLYQRAFDDHDGYRPGDGYNLNLGIKYVGNRHVVPQIQLNARYVQHDTGPRADTVATGGTLVYLTPGLSVPVTSRVSLYGFVQVPVYQDVRGVQLTPKTTVSVGARFSF